MDVVHSFCERPTVMRRRQGVKFSGFCFMYIPTPYLEPILRVGMETSLFVSIVPGTMELIQIWL